MRRNGAKRKGRFIIARPDPVLDDGVAVACMLEGLTITDFVLGALAKRLTEGGYLEYRDGSMRVKPRFANLLPPGASAPIEARA
jgi:hypothetical protein